MSTNPKYLLIIGCSQRKNPTSELLPAIERYDGGSFRVIRKAQREGYCPKGLDVMILSAKYGLIDSATLITNYEQRMNRSRANELKIQVVNTLEDRVRQNHYLEIYIDLGQDYLPAIKENKPLLEGLSITYAKGRIGERQRKLKKWLITKYKEQ